MSVNQITRTLTLTNGVQYIFTVDAVPASYSHENRIWFTIHVNYVENNEYKEWCTSIKLDVDVLQDIRLMLKILCNNDYNQNDIDAIFNMLNTMQVSEVIQ